MREQDDSLEVRRLTVMFEKALSVSRGGTINDVDRDLCAIAGNLRGEYAQLTGSIHQDGPIVSWAYFPNEGAAHPKISARSQLLKDYLLVVEALGLTPGLKP